MFAGKFYQLEIGQVENLQITETTEIMEKAVKPKQLHCLPAQNREINTQNPFDIAWEEKTKKIKILRDFRVFVLSPNTRKRKLGNHGNSTKRP